MKAVSTVVQAVLILAVIISLATVGLTVAQKIIKTSIQSAEITNIRADFLKCSDKILDTARTGSGNKCILSVSEGKLSVKMDGLYYSLAGESEICAQQEQWALIELNRQVWQRCTPSAGKNIYELRWFYPKNDVVILEGEVSVVSASGMRNFSLYQKGTLFVEFDTPKDLSGKTIELSRYTAGENTTVLSVSIS